ncbi:hypothetical protein DSL92_00375 [Billgrantia gudaonensis]|uniref:SsuA/THI5-like domain-containing protein n=1 Tax=Billgrantia gudaonensis TaxID=376427 RepID=A0A432JMB6_9GAMM|nr:hypothetical protein DSL92_00375 [Halomonas gudaonensis]
MLAPEVPSVAFEPAEPIAPPRSRLSPSPSTGISILNMQRCWWHAKGYFKRRGLDVTLVSPADPNVPAKLLAAGRTDWPWGGSPCCLLVDQGMPLVLRGHADRLPSRASYCDKRYSRRKPKAGKQDSPRALPQLHLGYTVQDSATLLNSPLATTNGLPDGMGSRM